MRRFLRLACGLLPALALSLTGCSEDPASVCAASSDCARGLSCQSSGVCGPYECTGSSDCLDDGTFTETCLQEDANGSYDPANPGVCSDQECRSDRDCDAGQICIDNACYNGTAGPIACGCREDCPAGDVCLGGECGASVGVCSDNCECPMGEVCEEGMCTAGTDACDGVVCETGECVEGECVGGGDCDPPCATGEVCNPDTLTCEGTTEAGDLCSTCTNNEECGGEADACIAIGEETICGSSCEDDSSCPDGFTCLPVDSRVGSQCIPSGGTCAGCLADGCPTGEFCNPFNGECGVVAETCAECTIDEECGAGSVCATSNGVDICLEACNPGDACGDGFTCRALAGDDVCAPEGDSCGTGGACDISADDCVDPLPVLDTDRCICVGCVGDEDCPETLVCTAGGNCVADGRPCTTTAECDGGYCQGGICVDCLTPGDCGPDEICQSGACVPCDCAPGEQCTATGECEEIPDPSSCSSDSECVGIARDLGFSGENAACDDTIGCYTIGMCNGSGGDDLGLGDLGFGGSTDPFNAVCPAGLTCAPQLDILNPSLFYFACAGCTVGDDSTCRVGESCTTPLLPLLSDQPYCSAGGGGFPFPFP